MKFVIVFLNGDSYSKYKNQDLTVFIQSRNIC